MSLSPRTAPLTYRHAETGYPDCEGEGEQNLYGRPQFPIENFVIDPSFKAVGASQRHVL